MIIILDINELLLPTKRQRFLAWIFCFVFCVLLKGEHLHPLTIWQNTFEHSGQASLAPTGFCCTTSLPDNENHTFLWVPSMPYMFCCLFLLTFKCTDIVYLTFISTFIEVNTSISSSYSMFPVVSALEAAK